MNFIGRLLGGIFRRNNNHGADREDAEKQTSAAMQNLQERKCDMELTLTGLQRRIDEHAAEAQDWVKQGKRDKAKLVMRNRKMLQNQAVSVQNNIDRMVEQILQMEMTQTTGQTVAALKQAALAGKANLRAHNIEHVDQVLEEIAEQNDQMVQITDALAQSTVGGIDEADLEAQLNALEGEQIDDAFVSPPSTEVHAAAAANAALDLPAAQTTDAAPQTAEEGAEREKLMVETGMVPAE